MASGIWPAVSGAIATERTVELTANNLANATTQGFKKDEPTFREYLAPLERPSPVTDIPLRPVMDKDFYPLDGRDTSHVVVSGTYTDFSPGNLEVTHKPLDLAIDGPGFFEVWTPGGIRYTKTGMFQLSPQGLLVTTEGYPVLARQPTGGLTTAPSAVAVQPGQGGLPTQGGVAAGLNTPPPDVVARFVNLADAGSRISVSEAGEVFAGENSVAPLSVVDFKDTHGLKKVGLRYFENTKQDNVAPATTNGPNGEQPPAPSRNRVRQGVIETSNVNAAAEMTRLINAHRTFEMNLKSMKVHDELMHKESNEIGKL